MSDYRLPLLCNPEHSLEIILWEAGALRLYTFRLRQKLGLRSRTVRLFVEVSLYVFREDAQLQGDVFSATIFARYFQLTTFKHLLSHQRNIELFFIFNLMDSQLCGS